VTAEDERDVGSGSALEKDCEGEVRLRRGADGLMSVSLEEREDGNDSALVDAPGSSSVGGDFLRCLLWPLSKLFSLLAGGVSGARGRGGISVGRA
jgi:hypothetical protein